MTDAELLARITQRDKELNSWAIRSFRDVADGDDIAARMAYRARLPVQFLWASQQTIEKYLKSILFIRRVPAKQVKHDLEPAGTLIDNSGIPLLLTDLAKTFIRRIDAVNSPLYQNAHLLDEILKYAYLPKDVVRAYREHALKSKSAKKT